MPYITLSTSVKLTETKHNVISKALGKIITEIPGKTEEWLMINLKAEQILYFKGIQTNTAAFVDVNCFGAVERKYKEIITLKICDLLELELLIPKDYIYIVFRDEKDWGWNGRMF